MNLDKAEFRAWLVANPEKEGAFVRGSACHCPIAAWLSLTQGQAYTVGVSTFSPLNWNMCTEIPLPAWARDFIRRYDRSHHGVDNPPTALEILDA